VTQNTALEIIDRQKWLDPLADKIQEAVGGVLDSVPQVKDFLHGTWLGHPLHSALTDVPVGAWTAALIMDGMEDLTGRPEFGHGADAAVKIGLAGAVAAAAAGMTDWRDVGGRPRKVGLAHALMNITSTLLFTASMVMRRNGSRGAAKGFSALGFAAAMGGAYLGGKLVYTERIGVDHTAGLKFPEEFTAVLPDAELGEGEMKRAMAGNTPVLVARRDSRIYAISEVCPHLGGPLAEGEFEGTSVRCPWHGSRFSLEDGRVLNGPSTPPARCLEARVQDGQIEIRLSRR
jgi:nitrite reductase/ring-hydroxylating ferredoxin subunit/uncharacterized membrane protein